MGENQKRRTNASIYGQQYTIVGYENEKHVREVADLVDGTMREIKRHNPNLDMNKLAVLTAVNIGHEYLKLLRELEEDEQKEEDM
ncbi:cell division protein ZapA [Texcoconibacillus texcoconensis]|uniref:Cell division protein ZapA n=1 Tax=Texcoconibacillus texcoconensis TaxID=1095777 RepID=A0A840QMV3_9BACI|nr:cell division protein ZapA [Texcoconibacillus texcoconensis]